MSRSARFYETWAWLTLVTVIVVAVLQLLIWGVIPFGNFQGNSVLMAVTFSVAGVIMIVAGVIAYGSLFTNIDLSENTIGAKIILYGLGIVAFFIIAVMFVLWIMGLTSKD